MLIDASKNVVLPPYVFNGVQYPPNIEDTFSDADLANLGLTRLNPMTAINANPTTPAPPVVAAPPAPPPIAFSVDNVTNACNQAINIAYTFDGVQVRGLMNTWALAVLVTDPAKRNQYDTECLTMVPLMNAWETAMLQTRDAAIAAATAPAGITWPPLPDGAEVFLSSCNQP